MNGTITPELVALIRFTVAGLLATLLILGLRTQAQRDRDRQRLTHRVAWPRDLRPESVAAFLAALSGLNGRRPPRFGRDSVVMDVIGTASGINHYLRLPRSSADFLIAQLRAAVPGVSVTKLESDDAPLPRITGARELRLTSHTEPLGITDAAATARTILSALSGVRGSDVAVWQLVIGGGTPTTTNAADIPLTSWLAQALTDVLPMGVGSASAPRTRKDNLPLTRVALRLGAAASSTRESRQLLAHLYRAAGSMAAPRARFVPRLLPAGVLRGRVITGQTPVIAFPALVSPVELLALFAAPLANPVVPGLSLGRRTQIPPSALVPRSGRSLGTSTEDYPRPVAISDAGVREGTLLLAPTGTGKSVLTAHMALSSIAKGNGGLIVCPKGSLTRLIAERLPESAIERTIYLDPTDVERPVPLPVFASRDIASREHAADALVSLLERRFGDLGPRSTDLLRCGFLTLARDPEANLSDIYRLWHDAPYRSRCVRRVADDYALASHWRWYEAMSPAERAAVLAAPANKLRPLLLRSSVRNVLGAPRATFSMREALARRYVVLVALPEGELGNDAVTLLGQTVLGQYWAAARGRSLVPPEKRRTFEAFIDEASRFIDSPDEMAEMLIRGREFAAATTLVAQSLGLFAPSLRETALNSARNLISLQASRRDAVRLAEEFGPSVSPDQLMGLDQFTGLARTSRGGAVLDPFTFRSQPLGPPIPGRYEQVRAASRERFGVPREEIEQAFAVPQTTAVAVEATDTPDDIGPIGRSPQS